MENFKAAEIMQGDATSPHLVSLSVCSAVRPVPVSVQPRKELLWAGRGGVALACGPNPSFVRSVGNIDEELSPIQRENKTQVKRANRE